VNQRPSRRFNSNWIISRIIPLVLALLALLLLATLVVIALSVAGITPGA
jgi:hypothetical protein